MLAGRACMRWCEGDFKITLNFSIFLLIEEILHKYIFLAKIIKVTSQNKVPSGHLPAKFEHDEKKKAGSNTNMNSLLLSRCCRKLCIHIISFFSNFVWLTTKSQGLRIQQWPQRICNQLYPRLASFSPQTNKESSTQKFWLNSLPKVSVG